MRASWAHRTSDKWWVHLDTGQDVTVVRTDIDLQGTEPKFHCEGLGDTKAEYQAGIVAIEAVENALREE